MKTLLTTTALAVTLAGTSAGFAQTENSPFYTQDAEQTSAIPFNIRASNLIGMRLYTSEDQLSDTEVMDVSDNWNDVGEISDVLIDRNGGTEAVLLDIGGFLGIGERTVAVTMDKLEFVRDGDDEGDFFIVVKSTADQLNNAPEFNTADVDAWTRDADAEMYARTADTGMMNEDTEMATDTELSDTDMTETEMADTDAAALPEDPEEVATAEDMRDDTPNELADNEAPLGPVDGAGSTQMAESDGMVDDSEGMVELTATELSSEELVGARVYDSNNEWVGEVSQLLLSDDGQVEEVVMDIGGFLGLGERQVAMSMDQIKLMRQNNDVDDISVHVGQAGDQLKEMPEWTADNG